MTLHIFCCQRNCGSLCSLVCEVGGLDNEAIPGGKVNAEYKGPGQSKKLQTWHEWPQWWIGMEMMSTLGNCILQEM